MKNWILLTFLLSQAIFISCENVPSDRPSIYDDDLTSAQVVDDGGETVEVETRPSGAIIIQSDYCACTQGEAISVGSSCESTCASKQASNDTSEKLFFNVELTEAITLGAYQDVYGWCNLELTDENGDSITGTGCSIEIKDEDGNTDYTPFIPSAGKTSFSMDLVTLNYDQTYRLTIVENTSEARSTTFQVRKYSDIIEPTGPLQLMPINRYTCMMRIFTNDGTSNSTDIENVNRFHLFFNSETRPEPLQESTISSFFCHDIETYGTTPINSPLLEESAGVFSLWYNDDPRFYDLDNDGNLDINQYIEQEVNLQGASLTQTPNLFAQLPWMSAFDDGDQDPTGNSNSNDVTVVNSELGFYMSPFLDYDTYKSYCPTQQHYYSDSPLFKAMREVVALDTEALYIAKEDNVCNFLLINEGLLSQIWFYIEGGQHIEPTASTVSGKQVQFYWPADTSSPFIKKSHQRRYTIKATDELSNACSSTVDSTSPNDSNGVRTNYPTHDKRIGCIPVLGN